MHGSPQDLPPDQPSASADASTPEQRVGRMPQRTEAQIRRAHRLESLGQLASGIAHDMNNVLGVILGYVELAKMNMAGADPKALAHMDKALSTLARARDLADRLLDFADDLPRPADVGDLNVSVQHVRELMSETLDRRVEFDVALAPDVPPPPLDDDGLRQIVMNLCVNAADAMPRGGRISLSTWREEVLAPGGPLAPGVYAAVRVRDTGPGISAAMRGRMFDPYVTTRPRTHSGLGLWVVRELAELHGGRVEVGGDRHGAQFEVWLPSCLAVTAAPSRPRHTAADAPAAAAVADVLIVDDEPGVREITRAFLEAEGYRVIEEGTGAAALERLQAQPNCVRLVFLDDLLPDARGSELAWQIARLQGAPQVVMVTGRSAAGDLGDLPAGTHVFPKPFLREQLSRLLREELRVAPQPTPRPAPGAPDGA